MNGRSTLFLVALAMELGFAVAIPMVGLAYIGSWADARFGTGPLFLIIGLLTGVFSGFYSIFRLLDFHNKNRMTGGKRNRD